MDLGLRLLARDDVDALVALGRACSQADGGDTGPTREMLEAQFGIPGLDITKVVWVLPGEGGALMASAAAVPLPSPDGETVQVGIEVHPVLRGQGLEERLLRFAEEQVPRVRKLPHLPGLLHSGARGTDCDRMALLERFGYEAARWFLKLERPLRGDLPEPVVPPGVAVLDVDPDAEAEALHFSLQDSFRDHWSPVEFTVEQFRHIFASPAMRPCVALLARAEDGDPAGVCVGRRKSEPNRATGETEGEVAMLGVRRPYRGRGLARAMLAESLRWMRDAGCAAATLDVDADSPTGANRLYASVGFTERRRTVVYEKQADAGA